jgi:hypothetical protein
VLTIGGSTANVLKLLKIEKEEDIQKREQERQAQQRGVEPEDEIQDQVGLEVQLLEGRCLHTGTEDASHVSALLPELIRRRNTVL